MAVKVTLGNGSIEQVADGESVFITDGHLHVSKWDGGEGMQRTVAVYAPNTWKRAHVEDAAQ